MARTLTRQRRRLMVAAADRSAGGWWRVAALCDPVSVPLRLRVYFATTQGDSVFTKHKQPPAARGHRTHGYAMDAQLDKVRAGNGRQDHSTPRNTTHHIIAVHIPPAQSSTPPPSPPTPHTSLTLLTRVSPNTKHERDDRTNSANWNGRHRADSDPTLRDSPRSSTRRHRV